jgi:hypothetical protein
VTYAEQTLGVHEVYSEAQQRLAVHKLASDQVVGCNRDLRVLHEALEMELLRVATDHAPNIPMGATKTDARESTKQAQNQDIKVQAIRQEIARLESDRASAEADLKHHALGIQVLTARMTELGGLLSFYSTPNKEQAT